jgi:hypothetical protein
MLSRESLVHWAAETGHFREGSPHLKLSETIHEHSSSPYSFAIEILTIRKEKATLNVSRHASSAI